MASDTQIVSFDANSLKDDIDRFQEREGYDTRSEAARELVRVGLRERNGPILARLKDQAIAGVYHLTLVALVVMVAGLTTTLIHPIDAFHIAGMLVIIAVAALAAVEGMRTLTGHNELADAWRRPR